MTDIQLKAIIHGDPVGYTRITQGQCKLMRIPDNKISEAGMKVKQRIRRYLSWKEFVAAKCLFLKINRRPSEKVYLDVVVYFSSRKHPDPENVRKGIQDALFEQDRMVAGCVDFGYDKANPRCEIMIRQGGTGCPQKA